MWVGGRINWVQYAIHVKYLIILCRIFFLVWNKITDRSFQNPLLMFSEKLENFIFLACISILSPLPTILPIPLRDVSLCLCPLVLSSDPSAALMKNLECLPSLFNLEDWTPNFLPFTRNLLTSLFNLSAFRYYFPSELLGVSQLMRVSRMSG